MNFDRNAIFCEVVSLPESDMKQYWLTCEADCVHKCKLIFESPKGLLFAYAEKSVAVFSSLCKKLEKADADNARRVGQKNLV